AMLLAALDLVGVVDLGRAFGAERGYERIDQRLNALGAKITRVPERGR
ncbi:MAG: UDP-N-acetylglucosamine 1-carboxyvinyltransferase, partial [Bradyrhizobium sp.]